MKAALSSSSQALIAFSKASPWSLGGLEVDHKIKLVGCMTGRSAGLAPWRIFPAYMPAWRQASFWLAP